MLRQALQGPASAITDGEVHFLWGFIRDGSIDADSWRQLMGGWGYCERHAWVALSVEMSFLRGFCIRSAYLYLHLLERGTEALARAAGAKRSVVARLRQRRRCLICELNPQRRGLLTDDRLAEGKDVGRLRAFAVELAPLWHGECCPRCAGGQTAGHLCRRHIIAAVNDGVPPNFEVERRHLANLLRHLEAFEKSFTWGLRGTDAPEDRAALLGAIGWCSGWSSLIALVGVGQKEAYFSDGDYEQAPNGR